MYIGARRNIIDMIGYDKLSKTLACEPVYEFLCCLKVFAAFDDAICFNAMR